MTTDPAARRNPVEELADEFLARYRAGDRPALSEYTDRYPDLADEIRDLFPALAMMEEAGPSGPCGGSLGTGGGTPERLGDYRILREVGRGGMGVVYEAVQESLGRHVAVKVLPYDLAADLTRLERFKREARSAARLHHTNIVPVYDVGVCQGVHYYAMQFIRGQGLDVVLGEVRRLRAGRAAPEPPTATGESAPELAFSLANALQTGQLAAADAGGGVPECVARPESAQGVLIPPCPTRTPGVPPDSTADGRHSPSELSTQSDSHYYRSVARLGLQVAEALAYAHGQKVLHRDIKPSNLLLDVQGTVWVTDFGLAKEEDSDLTRTGDVVGTLRYLAPERFQGLSDARSEVYWLGTTLYELLALRPAFADTDRNRLMWRIAHEEPVRLRRLDRKVPRDLETLVHKALAKEPGRRYQTAAELAEDLRRFLADRPILARPAGAAERAWRWCRRNPGLAASTAAAAVLLVAGVAVSGALAFWALRGWDQADQNAHQLDQANTDLRAEKARGDEEAAIAKAVNDFWLNDVLSQANIANQPAGAGRDKNITVRELLDRAAGRIDARFRGRELTKAAIRRTLGITYRALGEYPQAHQHLERALALHKEKLGAGHYETLQSMNELAAVWMQWGQPDKAEPLFKEVLEGLRAARDSDHPDTLNVVMNLAALETESGRYDSAEARIKQAVEGFRNAFGVEHPKTLLALGNLASLCSRRGRYTEAAEMTRQVIDGMRAVHGADHPLTWRYMRNLGTTSMLDRKYDEAEQQLKEVLAKLKLYRGADHPDTLTAVNDLAQVYLETKRYDQAEPLFLEAATGARKQFGLSHPHTRQYIKNLATVYEKLGQPELAEPLRRELAEVNKKR